MTTVNANGDAGIAKALWGTLQSPNESDSNGEAANVVDALVKAGRIVAGHDRQQVKALCVQAAVALYGPREDYDLEEVLSVAHALLAFCDERDSR